MIALLLSTGSLMARIASLEGSYSHLETSSVERRPVLKSVLASGNVRSDGPVKPLRSVMLDCIEGLLDGASSFFFQSEEMVLRS